METPVIVLALDSADPRVVRTLIDRGDMPHLAMMLVNGQWLDLKTPGEEGTVSVWPSLMTARRPDEHLFYADWLWDPFELRQRRNDWRRLVPFWSVLADRGLRSIVVDVPFQPMVRKDDIICVDGWGTHEGPGGPTRTHPRHLRREIHRSVGRHPFMNRRLDPGEGHNWAKRLANLCVEGVRMRGDLIRLLIENHSPRFLLAVFPESHMAGHQLFHTFDPRHPMHRDGESDLLSGTFQAIDETLGSIRSVHPDARMMILSLHGMRSTTGLPGILLPLLEHLGYCRSDSSPTAQHRLLSSRHRLPLRIREAYYDLVPRHVRYWFADLPFPSSFDWSQTRVFPIYSPVHGWLRINLEGREKHGIVPQREYGALRSEIRDLLEGLRREDGEPIAERVYLPPVADPVEEWARPDVVIEWAPGSVGNPLRLLEPEIEALPISPYTTGTHCGGGFVITNGSWFHAPDTSMDLTALIGSLGLALGQRDLVEDVSLRNPPIPHDANRLFMKYNVTPVFG